MLQWFLVIYEWKVLQKSIELEEQRCTNINSENSVFTNMAPLPNTSSKLQTLWKLQQVFHIWSVIWVLVLKRYKEGQI